MEEKSSSNVLKLKIRDVIIEVSEYISKCIPFFHILFSEKTDLIVEVNEVAPNFVNHLIDFFRNQKKIDDLKKKLESEFDTTDCKLFLKYLGMNDLYKKLYDPVHEINGKLIVNLLNKKYIINEYKKCLLYSDSDISLLRKDKYMDGIDRMVSLVTKNSYKLSDGSTVSDIDPDNTLHKIYDVILEDTNNYMCVMRETKRWTDMTRFHMDIYKAKYYINKEHIVMSRGSYYVVMRIYLDMMTSFDHQR